MMLNIFYYSYYYFDILTFSIINYKDELIVLHNISLLSTLFNPSFAIYIPIF